MFADPSQSPDAAPLDGLSCPQCGQEPAGSVDDFGTEAGAGRYEAEVTCCGCHACGSGRTAERAAKAAAARWLALYPVQVEED